MLTRPSKITAPAARAIRLTLYTDSQPYEITHPHWADVGHDRKHLRQTKTGPRDMILSVEGVAYLDRLQNMQYGKPFPYLKPEANNPTFRKICGKTLRGAGGFPKSFRLYDLRNTCASQAIMSEKTLAKTGAPLGQIDHESIE